MTADTATSGPPEALRRTPLYERHRALGAKMVPFNGWEMPVQYSSILEEHRAVRERAGLFDVCHMGEFVCEGPGALAFLESMVPNHVGKLELGQALYTQLCNEDGGTLDDLLIYHTTDDGYMIVVNAGTTDQDWAWLTDHAPKPDGVALINIADVTSLLALQGPRAAAILATLTSEPLGAITYYTARPGYVAEIPCRISRTGYTGEDGFELYCAHDEVVHLWDALLKAGKDEGLIPAGLGARDTLRLEAGYCLYGHELTPAISPLEAGLSWSVKLGKEADFIGRAALAAQKRDGLTRKLVGVKLTERGVPREGFEILRDGQLIGVLTSGTMLPTVGIAAGMGYVAAEHAALGTTVSVDIRGKQTAAEIVPLPFYKRPKA